jgi:hypothetical protein
MKTQTARAPGLEHASQSPADLSTIHPSRLLCQGCGAALRVDPSVRTATCPYCDSPQVIERPPDATRPEPVFALGFSVGKNVAHEKVRAWLRRRTAFARSGVHNARPEEVKGVYVPAYLFSGIARAEYSAEIGETYYETQTVGTGKNRRTQTVQRTEWHSLRGPYAAYLSDVLVTASRGVNNDELEAVEPFDLRQMVRYTPAVISGWVAEEASMDPAECAALGRAEADAAIAQRVRSFLPGDTQQNLQQRTQLESEALDLCLVPLWIFALRYAPGSPPMRVLVNGQTGKVHGAVPLSWVKITLTILVALAAVAAVAFFAKDLQLPSGVGR